jgi:hypothetical protein
MTVDPGGNVYVVGRYSNNLFQITPGGIITEIAGDICVHDETTFDFTLGIALASSGDVYVTCRVREKVYKITLCGTITEILGAAGDGAGNILKAPVSLAFDSSDNLYVVGADSDNVFQVTPGGVVTEIADRTGDGTHGAVVKSLNTPNEVVIDSSGNAFVVGHDSDNVLRIVPTSSHGPLSPVPFLSPLGIATLGLGLAGLVGVATKRS